MSRRVRSLALAALATALVVGQIRQAGADWPQDGGAICRTSTAKSTSCSVSDGSGGAVIAWIEANNLGSYDHLYLQRVDARGNALWAVDGVQVGGALGQKADPAICSDGTGGAIVAWADFRSGFWDIYAQRVDAAGTPLWTADGLPICMAPGTQVWTAIATDGAGGAIIAWSDDWAGNGDIYAQRVDASGTALWTPAGEAICAAAGNQAYPAIVGDFLQGAFVAWDDYRSGTADVYLQHVLADGSLRWPADGVAGGIGVGDQQDPQLLAHPGGDVSLVWGDARSGTYDVYGQRFSYLGNALWAAGGQAISTAAGNQSNPSLAEDATDGFIVAWTDTRAGGYDVYAQRVGFSGTAAWTANGVAVCNLADSQLNCRVVSDLAGGATIVWVDGRSSQGDLFAQRMDPYGKALWTAGGVPVLALAGSQDNWSVASDGAGGAIVGLHDTPSNYMLAQRIERNGYWGYPAPAIHAVADVPGDQGGVIDLAWDASRLDPYPEMKIVQYTLWKAVTATAAAALLQQGATRFDAGAPLPKAAASGASPVVVRLETLGDRTYYWRLVAEQPAYQLAAYSALIATEFDSTAASPGLHHFQVIAHAGATGAFWVSLPDSARSVDNLAPAGLAGLAGRAVYSPEGLAVSWRPSPEPDLLEYVVHRGTNPYYTPGPTTLVATLPDTAWFDSAWSPGIKYYYKAAALDIHGNVGPYAMLSPTELTDVETPDAPAATRLEANVPNPFNPATEIRFVLAAPGPVRLLVYDSGGRRVRTLLDGMYPAGHHRARWDGADGGGRAAAAGVYYCRLEAGGKAETRKMLLLR